MTLMFFKALLFIKLNYKAVNYQYIKTKDAGTFHKSRTPRF